MVGMVASAELNVEGLQEVADLIRTFPQLHDVDRDCDTLAKAQDDMVILSAWGSRQAEKRSQSIELQQQVALAERRLVSAKVDGSNSGELEGLREELAQAQARERQMQADVKYLEECIQAIEEQMASVKVQKESLDKPGADEAFLKNELSLFLNVSSILPDLSEPKFSGTVFNLDKKAAFVDKQRGVKTFKFSAADMTPCETCQAAWDMMS